MSEIEKYKNYLNNIHPGAGDAILLNLADQHIVAVPRFHVWVCNGNGNDAILLSQIKYWSSINPETGKPRISHLFKEHLWIVKPYREWSLETGIKERTAMASMQRLADMALVYAESHISPFIAQHGQNCRVCFCRVNWSAYFTLMQEYLETFAGTTYYALPGTTQHVAPGTTNDVVPIYTKTTTNTTSSSEGSPKVEPSGGAEPPTDKTEYDLYSIPVTDKNGKRLTSQQYVVAGLNTHLFKGKNLGLAIKFAGKLKENGFEPTGAEMQGYPAWYATLPPIDGNPREPIKSHLSFPSAWNDYIEWRKENPTAAPEVVAAAPPAADQYDAGDVNKVPTISSSVLAMYEETNYDD